jgi:hypothetical protein
MQFHLATPFPLHRIKTLDAPDDLLSPVVLDTCTASH